MTSPVTKGEPIHAALCCDENYTAYATVVMISTIAHASSPQRLVFHLISNGIESETQKRMQREITSRGSTLHIYEATNRTFDGLPVHRFGQAVYQRILLSEYLPEDISRIIYLDSDLLVRDDLAKLATLDLEGLPLGAVEDLSRSACTTIGVPRREYFNSGVLVMDLTLWRSGGIHWKVAEYAAEHAHRLHYVDQCSLNAVLHKDWLRLTPRWNAQANIYKILRKYSAGSGYPIEQLKDAIAWPAIVHFTGKKKPWLRFCFHPYRHEFLAILKTLEWAEPHPSWSDPKERRRYLLAIRDHLKNVSRRRQAAGLRRTRQMPYD
ncbi:glycosyltransferase family 8 protein [Marinobacter vulgaris]|uniref:Glycosyltransferase family 8 protein n=1 Tax=Marinobacter vulgaris TaxID=1928331 RepID=A0A2V3ZG33_9GAMM|nr:glycosyltransferase family 8 protein [Marinobacter vulgaris]PXX89311.1 glycosyltransferase family 8 protein [Marinobacter vulgaris]TSJ68126.1 glycosyltransferase family 8 protein [Marinobacter vulgaris]